MADAGGSTENPVQRFQNPEQGELDNNAAFTLKFDKAALEEERSNIAPQGHATLDAILRLPDLLAIPKQTMLIIGPNGIGKSTLLGVIDMLGSAVRSMKYNESWENAISMATSTRNREATEVKKMGLAPNIARHVTVVDGVDNIGTTRYWRIPEEIGKLWNQLSVDEQGYNRVDYVLNKATGKTVPVETFNRGTAARDAGVIGSTQQILDQRVFGFMEQDIASGQGPFTELLDEPTSNADLQRSLGLISELEQMSARQKDRAHFIIATNEGLLALNRNVSRIDMAHPERGVHLGRDYPLEEDTLKALVDMGYTPTQK